MEPRPLEAELFHVGGRAGRRAGGRAGERTDRQDEQNSRFSQFCERV